MKVFENKYYVVCLDVDVDERYYNVLVNEVPRGDFYGREKLVIPYREGGYILKVESILSDREYGLYVNGVFQGILRMEYNSGLGKYVGSIRLLLDRKVKVYEVELFSSERGGVVRFRFRSVSYGVFYRGLSKLAREIEDDMRDVYESGIILKGKVRDLDEVFGEDLGLSRKDDYGFEFYKFQLIGLVSGYELGGNNLALKNFGLLERGVRNDVLSRRFYGRKWVLGRGFELLDMEGVGGIYVLEGDIDLVSEIGGRYGGYRIRCDVKSDGRGVLRIGLDRRILRFLGEDFGVNVVLTFVLKGGSVAGRIVWGRESSRYYEMVVGVNGISWKRERFDGELEVSLELEGLSAGDRFYIEYFSVYYLKRTGKYLGSGSVCYSRNRMYNGMIVLKYGDRSKLLNYDISNLGCSYGVYDEYEGGYTFIFDEYDNNLEVLDTRVYDSGVGEVYGSVRVENGKVYLNVNGEGEGVDLREGLLEVWNRDRNVSVLLGCRDSSAVRSFYGGFLYKSVVLGVDNIVYMDSSLGVVKDSVSGMGWVEVLVDKEYSEVLNFEWVESEGRFEANLSYESEGVGVLEKDGVSVSSEYWGWVNEKRIWLDSQLYSEYSEYRITYLVRFRVELEGVLGVDFERFGWRIGCNKFDGFDWGVKKVDMVEDIVFDSESLLGELKGFVSDEDMSSVRLVRVVGGKESEVERVYWNFVGNSRIVISRLRYSEDSSYKVFYKGLRLDFIDKRLRMYCSFDRGGVWSDWVAVEEDGYLCNLDGYDELFTGRVRVRVDMDFVSRKFFKFFGVILKRSRKVEKGVGI